jgi:hypothetical protein
MILQRSGACLVVFLFSNVTAMLDVAHSSVDSDDQSQLVVLTRSLASEKEKLVTLQKKITLHQLFRNISLSLNPGSNAEILAASHIMDLKVYSYFIMAIRYLGGSVDFSIGNRDNFLLTPSTGRVFSYTREANPQAVFASFIGERMFDNIKLIGNGNLQNGYDAIQKYTLSHYPSIADAFGHLAEQKIDVIYNTAVCGPRVDSDGSVVGVCCNHDNFVRNHSNVPPDKMGEIIALWDASVHWEVAHQLSVFFGGKFAICDYSNIGVNSTGRDIEALKKEINDLSDFSLAE